MSFQLPIPQNHLMSDNAVGFGHNSHNSADEWASAMSNLDALLDLRPHPDVAGPGFFSDGDMLHTCSFGHGRKGTSGMTLNGNQTLDVATQHGLGFANYGSSCLSLQCLS